MCIVQSMMSPISMRHIALSDVHYNCQSIALLTNKKQNKVRLNYNDLQSIYFRNNTGKMFLSEKRKLRVMGVITYFTIYAFVIKFISYKNVHLLSQLFEAVATSSIVHKSPVLSVSVVIASGIPSTISCSATWIFFPAELDQLR